MVVSIQPCDWIEHDSSGKYVVDVWGRTEEQCVSMVTIEGFKPYFYIRPNHIQLKDLKQRLNAEITVQQKYDAYAGFNNFQQTEVWKIEVESLADFREATKYCKEKFNVLYETNLPPFLKLMHERDLGPASPITFQPSKTLSKNRWITNIKDIKADPSKNIPLKIAAYDIECMSNTGAFPVADPYYSISEKFFKNVSSDQESTLLDILTKCLTSENIKIPSDYNEKKLIPILEHSETQNSINRNFANEKDIQAFSDKLKQCFKHTVGDPIIQIGITLRWSSNMLTNVKRKVFVLGSVTKHPEYVSCVSENDVIASFVEFLQQEDPDIICGYNTYGFDDKYLIDRAELNGLKNLKFGRTPTYGKTLEQKTFELASGKYNVNFIRMPGRLSIDLLLNMRREHNLDSYTLDNVASTFLRDKVIKVEGTTIHTKTTRGLYPGNYVKFDIVGNTMDPFNDGAKFKVLSVQPKSFTIETTLDFDKKDVEWSFTKDDISPQDIFKKHEGNEEDRAIIAKYCIQDCDLVLTLMAKLDTLINARGMADVCFVPLQYLFIRGQGIKIFSRVAYEASKRNQIILTQESFEGDTAYEGAIVIEPKIGMYLDTPIAVLDFNSLYPSSMIGENLSPDTLICVKTYDGNGKLINCEGMSSYKEFPYNEVSYDIKKENSVVGKCVCIYYKPDDSNELSFGLIPRSLEIMLKKRKEARKKMEDPSVDDAQKSVYNGLQLAYKVVANSIYGQMGSKTSPIRKICVAACTTAVGRRQLLFAKSTVESEFGADVVYGDTDSIFVKFPNKTLEESINLGKESADLITSRCRHKAFVIGYEKTFYPFILFCRKRYVGMKYEEDPTKCKRASMGIVLKRRDNAPIVKDVFGGALDILLLKKDVNCAAMFVKDMIARVLKGDFPLEKFAITKQLRDDYAAMKEGYTGKATLPAHRVLANRMTKRDPGSAPNVGDRIKFIHIKTDSSKKLQGDKIEHIDYVRLKKIDIDTSHYITNQIQNPVAQLFALCIEQLEGYKEPSPSYAKLYETYMEEFISAEEATLKVLDKKEKQLEKILFLDAQYIQNILRSSRKGPLDSFFKLK